MYESLFKRYKDQDPRQFFAHFAWRSDIGEIWETPFQKLAEKAKPEDWDFHRPEFKKPGTKFPIIASYLNYGFIRLCAWSPISMVLRAVVVTHRDVVVRIPLGELEHPRPLGESLFCQEERPQKCAIRYCKTPSFFDCCCALTRNWPGS